MIRANYGAQIAKPILLLTIASVIVSCGGGGGSDSGNGGANPPPPPANVAPTANAGADQSVNEETVVSLAGTGTDTDGSISSYSWTQTLGISVSITNNSSASASFTAPTTTEVVTLTFNLTVTDDDNASSTDNVDIVVNPVNASPTASAGVDQYVKKQSEVTLNGSGTDTDGSIIRYEWRQISGISVILVGSNNAVSSFTSPDVSKDEVLEFELTVEDNEGTVSTATVTINVLFLFGFKVDNYEVLWDSLITLNHRGGLYVAVEDFNGDGFKDLLLGGENNHTLDKTPIVLLINDGNGSFTEQTSTYIEGDLVAAAPRGVTGDFNGDGIVDVAIFDAGNAELGQDPVNTGNYGEAPVLLLSNKNGKYIQSTALEDAQFTNSPADGGKLHVKSASAGDIDNDGDIDIFVESGGGSNITGHFMINNGDGTFVVDNSEERYNELIKHGQTGFWRYYSNDLQDMDGDGFLDLVLGQLRRPNNQQDDMTSRIVYNDGTGHFSLANSVELPYTDWYNTWTYVNSLQPFDLNGDGLKDLILAHIRAHDIDDISVELTGTYFQFLLNNGDRTFSDVTEDFIGDQTETASATSIYGTNNVDPIIRLVDMDDDGHLDIVIAKQSISIGVHAPFIFFNNGHNYFTPIDSDIITGGDEGFGEDSYPIDLNGDGLTDIVTIHRMDGPDSEWGTVDDTAIVISIIAH